MEIRVLTYNIRHGRGIDDKVDLGRVSQVLSESSADIICLQEVDRSLPRSGFIFQAERLAGDLGFQFGYHANFGLLFSGMGNAILSRYPLYSTWNTGLPFLGEPRGLLHAVAQIDSVRLDIFCTHWGLTPAQRRQQSRVTLSKVAEAGKNVIVCGDLNAVRPSVEVDSLVERSGLVDVGPAQTKTFPTNYPVVKIDYILATQTLKLAKSEVLAKDASDHQPILAHFRLDA